MPTRDGGSFRTESVWSHCAAGEAIGVNLNGARVSLSSVVVPRTLECRSRVLNTCLYLGFRAVLADRAEATTR
jgi:hypothetical protein